jgi:hypothetical protein
MSSGDFLIDDDNGIGFGGVGGSEFASAKQRNAHGMKVAGLTMCTPTIGRWARSKGGRPSAAAIPGGRVVAFERKIIGDRDAFHAGKSGDAGRSWSRSCVEWAVSEYRTLVKFIHMVIM